MGPRLAGGLLAVCLLGSACGGGEVDVDRYPDVRQRGAETEGGEQTPVERSEPPHETGGPHPQDELAGEDQEPL